MSDNKPTAEEKPIQLATRAVQKYPVPASKKQAQAFNRVLKRHNFKPLEVLIHDVLPKMRNKDKAAILLKLLEYQYPKMNTVIQEKKKRTQKIQVNTQVNVPQSAAKPVETPPAAPAPTARPALAASNIEELMKIASGQLK
jgi:leucyl aminopeptidase